MAEKVNNSNISIQFNEFAFLRFPAVLRRGIQTVGMRYVRTLVSMAEKVDNFKFVTLLNGLAFFEGFGRAYKICPFAIQHRSDIPFRHAQKSQGISIRKFIYSNA